MNTKEDQGNQWTPGKCALEKGEIGFISLLRIIYIHNMLNLPYISKRKVHIPCLPCLFGDFFGFKNFRIYFMSQTQTVWSYDVWS